MDKVNDNIRKFIKRDIIRVIVSNSKLDYLIKNEYYKKFSFINEKTIKNLIFSYLNRLDNKQCQ